MHPARLIAGILGTGLVVLGLKLSLDPTPFPFVRGDVALAHALASLPLAFLIARALHQCLSERGALLTALLLACFLMPTFGVGHPLVDPIAPMKFMAGLAVRSLIMLSGLTAFILATHLAVGASSQPTAAVNVAWIAAILMLLIVPWTYVDARCRRDLAELDECMDQMRLGTAHRLAREVLQLDPGKTWKRLPLRDTFDDLDHMVRRLEKQTRQPLRPGGDNRLERARQLAMLGRAEAALDMLNEVREPALARFTEGLRGTIHEEQGRWLDARTAFERARAAWNDQPASAARTAGLQRTAIGIAYSQRKLGRYAEAEATYLGLLDAEPNADIHFLLAQLYEDSQQAEKAREHARVAMSLEPSRYHQRGERLIAKLATSHFGCYQVFAAERDSPYTK